MFDKNFWRRYSCMYGRCHNKNHKRYKYYGGKGILILWKNYAEFKHDMYDGYLDHLKRYGLKETTLDRIDNNKNYCKENCRWATRKEQNRNHGRNVFFTIENRKMCINEILEKYNLNYYFFCRYYRNNLSLLSKKKIPH